MIVYLRVPHHSEGFFDNPVVQVNPSLQAPTFQEFDTAKADLERQVPVVFSCFLLGFSIVEPTKISQVFQFRNEEYFFPQKYAG